MTESEQQILSEIKSLRKSLSKLIGTEELPDREKFSKAALEKAAKEFSKLSIARGEWIDGYNIDKIIRGAPYNAGKFIQQEFGFANCFKRGVKYYYSRKDLMALARELKKRNVNLGRYMELKADQDKFEKYVQSILVDKDRKVLKKKFNLPEDLHDINTSPAKLPKLERMNEELEKLKEEFSDYTLSDYVDIYKDNYAMVKSIYYFQKYLDPNLKKQIFKWVENFNLVNRVKDEITD